MIKTKDKKRYSQWRPEKGGKECRRVLTDNSSKSRVYRVEKEIRKETFHTKWHDLFTCTRTRTKGNSVGDRHLSYATVIEWRKGSHNYRRRPRRSAVGEKDPKVFQKSYINTRVVDLFPDRLYQVPNLNRVYDKDKDF